MKIVYTKMKKHNREENVMKGFIEVVNQIKDECRRHRSCSKECIFNTYLDADGNGICIFDGPPEHLDPLEIMRRLQAHD